MAISFGSLGCKVRNIVTYTLSPYELKAFGGAFSKGIPNTFNRVRGQFFRVATPFALAYLVYDWGTTEHDKLMRKDASIYANDE